MLSRILALTYCLFISIMLFNSPYVQANDIDKSKIIILETAEKLFISLKERRFTAAWDLLTEKSHNTIINDVYNNSIEKGIEINKQNIINDFNNNGVIFNNYWEGFLNTFDPDIVLYKRVWEFGEVTSDKAVILLKGKVVTKLEMFKEKDIWKTGLVESFWKERDLKILPYILK